MFGDHHRLLDEFPEYKDQIHELKINNAHFAKLYDEYMAVDNEIYRIEEEIDVRSDEFTEGLKKKRLKIKDQLFDMLRKG